MTANCEAYTVDAGDAVYLSIIGWKSFHHECG
jgi:hypothetical protein